MDQTLIIGLGNPDPTLTETYHNVGVIAVEWFAENAPNDAGDAVGPIAFRRHGDLFAYAKVDGKIFVRPLVYMNESGRAVSEAMRVFNADAKHIAIVHDDSDITIGDYRVSDGGRAAGHKGIQSIIDHLHTEDFKRVRIGIREKNEVHRKKAGDFVLSPISHADQKIFEEVFAKISDALFSAQRES